MCGSSDIPVLKIVLPWLGSKWLSQPSQAILSQAKLINQLMTKSGLAQLTSWLSLAQPMTAMAKLGMTD